MGTWIGSSFPYSQFGRHPPMGVYNCADVTSSLSAMGTGSMGVIRDVPRKAISSRNSTPSSGILNNESRPNGTARTLSKIIKGKRQGLTTEPAPGSEAKRTTTSSTINNNASNETYTDSVNSSNNKTAGKEYLVDTPSCKIPRFDPWDASLLHAIKKLDPLNCGNQRRLTYVQNGTLAINDSILESDYGIQHLANVSCCYRTIQRPEGTKNRDENAEISKECVPFFNSTPIEDEFVKVECGLQDANRTQLTEFHYTVPSKADVESRCQNATVELGERPFSVMLLGMDALSRLNFERHLVKTRRVLMDTLGAVEMLGYTKVGDNTFPNVVPLLAGLSVADLKERCWANKKASFDACPWVWKDFARSGYRTLYGEDSVRITSFNYLKPGFQEAPTDYYLRPFLLAAEPAVSRARKLNTALCLGPEPHHEVSLRWAAHFMEAFADRPYFGLLWSNSLTHDNADQVQRADDFLSSTLTQLHARGQLNTTILIVLSDHGIRWGALRETLIGRYEERLPALYVSLPETFRKRFPERWRALAANAHRLTSPFDLHATLRELLRLAGVDPELSETGYLGQSLFQPVPLNRTCREAGINAHWCACQESVSLDVRQGEAHALAAFLLRHVNNRTREVRDRCEVFSLSKILSVLRKTSVQMHGDEDDSYAYVVTIGVTPGGGVFEATILTWEKEKRWSVEGEVSRLNLYGKQADCVEDTVLRKMCFCHHKTESPRRT